MKILFLSLFSIFASFFIRLPNDSKQTPSWPENMPRFAQGISEYTFSFASGSEFVSFSTSMLPDEALASASSSFCNAGWILSGVRTHDMILFTKKKSVAAVLARPNKTGSRVTAILRPNGL
jgi:hypothetical protein